MKKQITKVVITVALLVAIITPIFYKVEMKSQTRVETATVLYYETIKEPIHNSYVIYAETADGNIYSYSKLFPPKSKKVILTLDKNDTPKVQDDEILRVKNEG